MTSVFEGRVENFDGLELVGWVRFDPSAMPELCVEVSGLGRRKIEALGRRSDLVAKMGEGSGEFRVALDKLFPEILGHGGKDPATPYCVHLIAQNSEGTESTFFEFTGDWSLVEAASAARPKSDGRIDNLDDKWIGGWVVSDEAAPARIEIVVDGKPVATATSGLFRGDVERLHKNGKFSGFVIATPQALRDGFPHSVAARLKSGWQFPGFPREVRLGAVLGTVERIERNTVEGWFGFVRDGDGGPTVLTVLCNGETIGVTTFRSSRPDVVLSGLATSAYAFRFETKREIFSEDLVAVTYGDSSYRLRIAENARATNLPSAIVGHLDRAGEAEIVGWAVDRRSSGDSLRIIAFVDGLPITEAKTEGFRADVQRTFPQALRPGFTIRTPKLLRDGLPHQLELRVATASGALRGTPTTVQFSRQATVFRFSEPSLLDELRAKISSITKQITAQLPRQSGTGVSHIILNKNGSTVFVRCLVSLLNYLDFHLDELIVVDHASSDISHEALRMLEEANLVRVIWKSRNDSFARSNNDAAAVATRPNLLLLNNDIEFVMGISRQIERHLDAPDVGVVGIKLYDIVEQSPEDVLERSVRDLRIQHLGVWFHTGHVNSSFNMLGYDITSAATHREIFGLHEVAVVTGAALGMRTKDFISMSGFDETYFYGTEDIDLCLRVRLAGKRIVCDRNLEALHVRGYTRFTRRGGDASERFAHNNRHLWNKLGAVMRRDYMRSRIARNGVYGPPTFRIGFAVTEAASHTVAGDYFTALEFARALAEHSGIEYAFLSEREDWYDCAGLDALVVMRHDYDLRQIRNQHAQCLLLGWARNQFDTWLNQPWLDLFDAIFSSSMLFSNLLWRSFGIDAHLLYIATGFEERTEERQTVKQDVVFIGSRWGGAREIEHALIPDRINGSVRVYGDGLADVPSFRPVWGGKLPYAKVEAEYHRSLIVVDDANSTTKRWGSPNSRVFDAIQAGAVVLTNSRTTSAVLGNTLPVWKNADDLTEQINQLLADRDALARTAHQQASVVRGQHTYKTRASSFLTFLKEHAATSLRIDILTAIPRQVNEELWGDWHFAQSLARAFRKKGHAVRIRKLEDKPDRATDVVLALRGLQRFDPVIGAINLLWIISHPDLIAANELKGWQHIFVASQTLEERLAPYSQSISVLEQGTDCKPSALWVADRDRAGEICTTGVFVGNTRGVKREFIHMAAEAGTDFRIWGNGWKGSELEDRLLGTSIENKRLGSLYAGAPFVLSDHWPDMAAQGIVSNRIFDALAAGGVVISDPVAGLEALNLPNLFVCRTHEEIRDAATKAASMTRDERFSGGKAIAERFSFDRRAELVLERVAELLSI